MTNISKTLVTTQKPLPPSDKLGFGNYFTDHMFVAKYSEEKGWYEASIQPYGPLSIDPGASVFHYGQALFEGMKAFRQGDDGKSFSSALSSTITVCVRVLNAFVCRLLQWSCSCKVCTS